MLLTVTVGRRREQDHRHHIRRRRHRRSLADLRHRRRHQLRASGTHYATVIMESLPLKFGVVQ